MVIALIPATAFAQAMKPAGLRPAAGTKDTVAKDSTGKAVARTTLAPPKSALSAEKLPPKLPSRDTVGLSAAEKRRINNAMTRPRKAPGKPPLP